MESSESNQEIISNHENEHKENVNNRVHKRIKKINISLVLSSVLVLILLINVGVVYNVQKEYNKKLAEANEKNKPALINLISIKNSDCKDCFKLDKFIENIKSNNVNVQNEKTLDIKDSEAVSLIKKYGIQKLPALVVTGEIDKINSLGLEQKEDSLVYEQTKPLYFDLITNKEVGKVTLVHIKDSLCKECTDIGSLTTQLIKEGVVIVDEKTIELNNAKHLIDKYNITKIPSIIFSKDLGEYKDSRILSLWNQIGSIEPDGGYITRNIPPPYINVATNKIEGFVNLIYLTDKSCDKCYNVSMHKQILLNLGLFLANEKMIDISSSDGKDLISKYNITKVPMIIMSGDMEVYSSLKTAWSQVGSIESDSSYIFRNIDVMGVVYKDLTSNTIVQPKPQDQGGMV